MAGNRARLNALAGIDAVPWASLHHAYGPASDVPQLLKALTTKKHRAALDELCTNIVHQGTIYEATAHAVPFLVAIACDPRTADRPAILGLLGAIMTGTGYSMVHNPRAAEAVASEQAWIAAVRQAIASGFDPLVNLLVHDDEPKACAAAAHVLARIEGRQTEVATILATAIERERDQDARCGMLLAARLLGPAGAPLVPALRAVLDDHRAPIAIMSLRRSP